MSRSFVSTAANFNEPVSGAPGGTKPRTPMSLRLRSDSKLDWTLPTAISVVLRDPVLRPRRFHVGSNIPCAA